MDATILLFLVQDGLTNGAIYALLGFALVLLFTVTRTIFIPQGDFVAYGALTYALLRAGQLPGTVKLLAVFGATALAVELWSRRRDLPPGFVVTQCATKLGVPLAIWAVVAVLGAAPRPVLLDLALTIAIVGPMGPYLYRIVFQPLGGATVLTLFIAAVAVHIALIALGLAFFGPEGQRAPALIATSLKLGPVVVSGQSLAVYATTILLTAALSAFFALTLRGKALHASAVNALGARLVGIDTHVSAKIAFALAATIGAVSGVLIVPMTTIYYDSGFVIGLKGFVAAIFGGLGSFIITGMAAFSVGIVEALASFFASSFKEIIVFSLIIPVLLVRSARSHHGDDEDH